jgi:hypothetical protein
MSASPVRIPHVPAELIPLLDTVLEGWRTAPPRRQSPQQLANIRAGLTWAAEAFGADSAVFRRALLLGALEHARAEVVL